jgi:hypothetical protein
MMPNCAKSEYRVHELAILSVSYEYRTFRISRLLTSPIPICIRLLLSHAISQAAKFEGLRTHTSHNLMLGVHANVLACEDNRM